MKLKNTILAIIGGATVSAALAVNVHITTEDHSQVGAAIVHQPVGIRPAGVVGPIESCGGSGRLIQVRVQDCNAALCNIQPNTDTLLEIDWMAHGDYDSATITVTAQTSAGDIVLVKHDQGSGGIAGELGTTAMVFRVPNALSKQTISLMAQIEDEELMLCAKFPSTIYLGQELLVQGGEL